MGATIVRYSEAFKLTVVREIESGKLASITEAQSRYGIRGSQTVKGWVAKFGRNNLLARVVRVETTDEKSEIERLRRQLRETEQALAKIRVRELLMEGYLEAFAQEYGVKDLEALKKKLHGRLSTAPAPVAGKGV